ncbi:hypothetical protein ACIGHG_23380 [Bacillus sp. NPDC077411]|uniref:hypothetical protein n=1 Tax=Bacillus sp. NPDC077411 TaxID=3363947 RepID=UPI0037C9B4FC
MRKLLTVQTDEQKWFAEFRKTDEFAAALAFVWRNGHESSGSFILSDDSYEYINEFCILINGVVRSNKNNNLHIGDWYCTLGMKHPFVIEMVKMGWKSGSRYDREYPQGEFNDEVFIKTYIWLRHDLNRKKSKRRRGIYFSPRLRIYGSGHVLQRINQHLHKELGISTKTIQLESKKKNIKTINYQSVEEVPRILEYIGATESLERFYSFDLGYQD